MKTRLTGNAGEDTAAEYLRSLGWEILERNWSCRFGELDIVALPDAAGRDELAFVEVKFRTSTRFGSGLEAVIVPKQKKIVLAATHWMNQKRGLLREANASATQVRFDVIDVGPSGVRDHVERAW